MFHYWEKNNKNFGKDVFIKHAGYHIPKEKWSERTIEECVE
jgi:ubiquinone biosynthesis protein COQ9